LKDRIVFDNEGRIIEGVEYLERIAAAPDHQTEVEIVNPPLEIAEKLADSMAAQRKEKFGKYSLAFRITRSKSGFGFDVKPFDLSPVNEPTTFALCIEVSGQRQADGSEMVWMETNTRTLQFGSQNDGHDFDEAASDYLNTLWSRWCHGETTDPVLAQQFAAVQKDSKKTLKKIYGKAQGFTKSELGQLAAEWHEALERAKYWDGLLPRSAPGRRGLRGWYSAG
jgi:hypothetical protein